jgi:DNA-binding LytR/AlgR family response regulator
MYIGVHKKNVYFHMQDGGDIQVGSRYLHYYAEEAKKHGFMQVRRDIMVNTRYIANVDFNSKIITLDGGVELGIGDAYRSALEGYVKRYELETVVKK